MRIRMTFLALLLCLSTVAFAQAQSLPSAKPEQVGLSTEQLNKVTAMLKADVEKGVIPGRSCWWRATGKSPCSTRSVFAIRRPRRR